MWGKSHLNGIPLPSNGITQSPGAAFKTRYIPFITRVMKLYEECSPSFVRLFPNGTLLLLTWSWIIHVFGCYPLMVYLRFNFKAAPYASLYLTLIRALLFLFYPLFNYLGEYCWSRYKIMICGTVLSLIGVFISGPCISMIIRSCMANFFTDQRCFVKYPIVAVSFTGILIYFIGVSLFEANSLQFGVSLLQSNSKKKVRTFVSLYVWTIHISEYCGLPLVYFLVHLGSPYWCACCLLLPVFLLFVCSREKRHNLIADPVKQTFSVFKLLTNYVRNNLLCRRFVTSNKSTIEPEDSAIFNRFLTLFLSLLGYHMMQSSSLPRRMWFDFDDDWLIGYRLHYTFAVEIIEVLPLFALVLFVISRRRNFFVKIKPIIRLKYGVMLSVFVLLSSWLTMLEFRLAYDFNRSLRSFVSVSILAISFIKGLANLLVIPAILESVLLYSPVSIQGPLISLWHCFRFLPYFFLSFSVVQRYSFIPLSFLTILAIVSTLIFQLSHRRLLIQRPQSQLNRNGLNV